MKKYLILGFLLFIILLSTPVFAQSTISGVAQIKSNQATSSTSTPRQTKPYLPPEGTVSCFDYYKFGSVYASLESGTPNAVSGTEVSFFGSIKNDNPYPIADGKLFVKIMRQNDAYDKTSGQDEVDSFVVKQGISIPANSSIPTNFSWKIPAYALSGDYQVATYFVVADNFNMSGLSFTTDIVGGTVNFKVLGEQKKGVYFDRTKIKFNEKDYYTVGFVPTVKDDEKVNMLLPLKNDTDSIQRVPVTFKLYKWDSQNQKNLISTKDTVYLISPKSSIDVPYAVEDTAHSVYYVSAMASYKDTKSEIAVRFAREGKQEPRIAFSTFMTYPIVKGQANNLITCVNNTNNSDADYGKVVTSIYDYRGDIVFTNTYEGKITSAIQGMLAKFTPRASYKDMTLETKIYDKSGAVVDETNVIYKCSDLSNDCKEPFLFDVKTVSIVVGALLILAALSFLLVKKLKKKNLVLSLLLLFLLGGICIPRVGEAKSVDWNGLFNVSLGYNEAWTAYGETINPLFGAPSFKVTYYGIVKNLNTNQELGDGSVVNAGDKLRFIFGKSDTDLSNDWEDIYWFMTGGAWSSPYGDWVANANTTLYPNNQKYYLNGYIMGQFAVNPPSKNLINTNNLTCGSFDSTNRYIDCTANDVATNTPITPKISYGSTYGKLYILPTECTEDAYLSESVFNTKVFQGLSRGEYSDTVNLKNAYGTWQNYKNQCTASNLPSYKNGFTLDWNPQGYVLADPTIGPTMGYTWGHPLLTITAQTIPFSFSIKPASACSSNVSPGTPTISGPASGMISDTLSFKTSATDPNADQIRYEVYIDGTKAYDSGMLASGTEYDFTRQWTTAGTTTVKVRAVDGCGSASDWAAQTVVIGSNMSGTLSSFALSSVTPNACGDVKLNWTPSTVGASYEVYKETSPGVYELLAPTNNATALETNPPDTVGHNYKVLAIKQGFNSIESNVLSVASAVCPSCGSANGSDVVTKPTSGLCSFGTSSAIPETTAPFSWSCSLPSAPVSPVSCSSASFQNLPTGAGSCVMDGLTVASGTGKIFYSNRVSKNCDGKSILCVNGTLTGADISVYKYRSCISPKPSEF